MDVNYKAQKLLRLQFELDYNIINDIKICGDFFIHPEEKIVLIEEALIGVKTKDVRKVFDEVVQKENIQVIGFNGEDLQKAIDTL